MFYNRLYEITADKPCSLPDSSLLLVPETSHKRATQKMSHPHYIQIPYNEKMGRTGGHIAKVNIKNI